MKIEVKTIEAYRVARSDEKQEVFVQVNNSPIWVLLRDCLIGSDITMLYFDFPHFDPDAKAWEEKEHNIVFRYVPKGKTKQFILAKGIEYFDNQLAELSLSKRQPRVKRKQPEPVQDPHKDAKASVKKQKSKQGKQKPAVVDNNGSSASKKSKAQQKVVNLPTYLPTYLLLLVLLSLSSFIIYLSCCPLSGHPNGVVERKEQLLNSLPIAMTQIYSDHLTSVLGHSA